MTVPRRLSNLGPNLLSIVDWAHREASIKASTNGPTTFGPMTVHIYIYIYIYVYIDLLILRSSVHNIFTTNSNRQVITGF